MLKDTLIIFVVLTIAVILSAIFLMTYDKSPKTRSPKAVQKTNIDQASMEQTDLIQAALGEQYPISKTVAIRSGNHKSAYYVGAVFHAQGVGNMLGIWLVGGDKNSPNLVYSVDGTAHQFSGMRKASETKAYATINDPESKAIKGHLKP